MRFYRKFIFSVLKLIKKLKDKTETYRIFMIRKPQSRYKMHLHLNKNHNHGLKSTNYNHLLSQYFPLILI